MPKIVEETFKSLRRTITITEDELREIFKSRKSQNLLGELPEKCTLTIKCKNEHGASMDIFDFDKTVNLVIEWDENDKEELRNA